MFILTNTKLKIWSENVKKNSNKESLMVVLFF